VSLPKAAPADLLAAHSLAYLPCGFGIGAVQLDAESADYGACTLVLNGLRVCFRVAKTTPTKTGQFVTLWKRAHQGPIQPFDRSDPVDAFVVSTRSDSQFGQFVFPRAVLAAKGVLATHGHGGKRAIRVYPPWAAAASRQAQATQIWQAAWFVDLSAEPAVDLGRVKSLFRCQISL
jgi:hypothetical protein